MDSLDLDGDNRERTRLHLFQFSLRDQASNWLERLPAGSITTWEDLTTRFLAQFFPPGRTAKLRNDILMFQQHHGDSLSGAWTRFKDLLQKVPHHGIDLWLQLRDLNTEESWALLKDLALYDNKIWNDPRDFAKPVKAISLPQDVLSTSDHRLIELKNQVQRLMEAHLALTQPTQVNKITTSCEIFSGPHDTQYCMEDPKQAFVEYASSRTDETGERLVFEFMASQDARLSKFEADFKQQQSEMTNKIDTVLKAITDRIVGMLPSDTVKNLKLGTHPVSLGDSKPFNTLADLGSCINIIPLYFFKKLNIRLLEETDHIVGLAGGTKSYPVGIVKDVEVHIGKLKLLNDFYVIDMKKDPETPLLVGKGFLATFNVVIDYRMAKIAVGEGITRSVFDVKEVDLGAKPPYYARKDFLDCHLPREWEISRDAELNPFKDTLVFRRMDKPPKNGDGAWHAKIRLIDPDGEEFNKTLQSIPTTRKLSERESPREIIDLDQFYDT
ncbi:MAK10-like protein [Tanacetum coccineum]